MIQVMMDADALTEYTLYRKNFIRDAEALVNAIENLNIQGFVTDIGFGKMRLILEKLPHPQFADDFMSALQSKISVCQVDSQLLLQASSLNISDIESALEVVCASHIGVGAIVTLNPSDFDGSKLPVLSVEELLERQKLESRSVLSGSYPVLLNIEHWSDIQLLERALSASSEKVPMAGFVFDVGEGEEVPVAGFAYDINESLSAKESEVILTPSVESTLSEFENAKQELDERLEELEKLVFQFDRSISELSLEKTKLDADKEDLLPSQSRSLALVDSLTPLFDDDCNRFKAEVEEYRAYIIDEVLSLKQTDWGLTEIKEAIKNIQDQTNRLNILKKTVYLIQEELAELVK